MTARPWPRVRKARRSSLVACGHYVLTGQLIVNRGAGRCGTSHGMNRSLE